jgi:putative ABC transport system permease protein
LLGAIVLGAAVLVLARDQDVPVVLNIPVAALCVVLAMGLAGLSGLVAVHGLRRADPASLLR